uniref:Uncharacterized protein n=1 Tax=Rhizophora mucronata TaxID=61149 RepID=A0A2P2P0K3_RHIMU
MKCFLEESSPIKIQELVKDWLHGQRRIDLWKKLM